MDQSSKSWDESRTRVYYIRDLREVLHGIDIDTSGPSKKRVLGHPNSL